MDTIKTQTTSTNSEVEITVSEDEMTIYYPEKDVEFTKDYCFSKFEEFEDYRGIRLGQNKDGDSIFHALSSKAIQKVEEALESHGHHVTKGWEPVKKVGNIENQARENILGGEAATEGEFRNGTDYDDPTPRRPEGGTYH